MKPKFIECVQQKSKYPNIIVGIEISQKDGIKSVVGVDKDNSDICVWDVPSEEYKCHKIDSDKVRDYFQIAFLKLSSDVNEAESRLLLAKRNHNFAQIQINKYFKTNKTKPTKGAQNANRPTT